MLDKHFKGTDQPQVPPTAELKISNICHFRIKSNKHHKFTITDPILILNHIKYQSNIKKDRFKCKKLFNKSQYIKKDRCKCKKLFNKCQYRFKKESRKFLYIMKNKFT